MAINNKFKVFADNSSNLMNDETYRDSDVRKDGNIANTIVSSRVNNTALKTSSLIAVALIDALGQLNPSSTLELGLGDSQSNLATKLATLISTLSVLNATNAQKTSFTNTSWSSVRTSTIISLDKGATYQLVFLDEDSTMTAYNLGLLHILDVDNVQGIWTSNSNDIFCQYFNDSFYVYKGSTSTSKSGRVYYRKIQ